ncbi:Serine dehydratase-like [Hypsizygus marmoreus]|uniref:L-serine ammonia-lyase n=1 Tax=Hypsizygus marmoreus TaxID=39966 RepID=A0A369JRM7_HYPMA|nr:Serine dehydratase-like [Hypsizygus marmoreus]
MGTNGLWQETPLIYSSQISGLLGVSAYLKLENLHPSHSFKYRGISLFAQKAREAHGPSVHLIAASGGNAGLAAACAANALGVKCTVYIPAGAAPSTLDILLRQKAEVIVTGRYYAEALEAASAAVEKESHAVMVPAYDHEIVWEGHGSMIKEISTQLQGTPPDAIFCSVGGGGMLGGIIVGCNAVGWNNVPIVTLETVGSNCFYHSMSCNDGRFNSVDKVVPSDVEVVYDKANDVTLTRFNKFTSRASGSLGASLPSARVVKMALEREGAVCCASVPDEMSMQALLRFADDHKLLVELACSTTLVPAYNPALFNKLVPPTDANNPALFNKMVPPTDANKPRTVVFIVCGGFKVSLEDVAGFRRLVNEDVDKGGVWNVLCNDGDTFSVEK